MSYKSLTSAFLLCFFGALCTSHSAWAGTWEITNSPTNSCSSSPSVTQANQEAAGFASSKGMSAVLLVSAGQTTSTQTAQASAAYSGTWTFHWVPDNATDWPSAYTIRSIKSRVYKAVMKSGTGSAHIKITGGANLVTVNSSSTAAATNVAPTVTTAVDTSVTNLTKTTKTMSGHSAILTSSGEQVDSDLLTITTDRAYTASYFTSNFATPSAIVIAFTVDSVDLSADLTFSGSASSSVGAAMAFASETYKGNP